MDDGGRPAARQETAAAAAAASTALLQQPQSRRAVLRKSRHFNQLVIVGASRATSQWSESTLSPSPPPSRSPSPASPPQLPREGSTLVLGGQRQRSPRGRNACERLARLLRKQRQLALQQQQAFGAVRQVFSSLATLCTAGAPCGNTRPARWLGVPLSGLRKEQLNLHGVPLLLDHCVIFLRSFLVDDSADLCDNGRSFDLQPVHAWSEAQVANWLEECGYADCVSSFATKKINGRALLAMTEENFAEVVKDPARGNTLRELTQNLHHSKKNTKAIVLGGKLTDTDMFLLFELIGAV
eukprot:TRINITY_DN4049_c0_g2_i4.p1 TRINITY_DN4049_c0_g2~~TRINITY_DN4049_c0_g2_i4.p1  ORF type:complete len:297 (-),score=89.78 TRINITY_DN4049_c0_g2_i4:29-919(-)